MVQRNSSRLLVRGRNLALTLILTLALGLTLAACGGGGGGGGGGAVSVTGTVSDSTRLPLAGASVKAYDATDTEVGTATSDAAGRYVLRRLPAGEALTIVAAGPSGTFPAQTTGITVTAGVATVLDLYLPSTAVATSPAANLYESAAVLRSAQAAVLDVTATTFSAAPTDIYLAPYDVNEIGNGYPIYSVSPFAAADSSIDELFAAAAVEIVNGGAAVTFDTADLYLPIPASLIAAADAADSGDPLIADTDELYRFDPLTNGWIVTGIDPIRAVDPANGDEAFLATITEAGFYRVGMPGTNNADSIPIKVYYQDGITEAAGVTVYVNGDDYGYQQVGTTSGTGDFTALVKTGGSTSYEFVVWGYGLQLSHGETSASITLPSATVNLPFDAPTANVPAAATITLDSVLNPISIGLITASGRMSTDAAVIDGTIITPGRADISFNIDAFNGLTVNGTTKASGIQEVTGTSFDALTVAPTSGYSAYSAGPPVVFPTPIIIDPAGGQVIVVQTDVGYAKIGIDSVSGTDPATLVIRSAFSLTGRF